MADLQENQYATTDFTRGGSGIGNFSLSRARVMAVRTAQATPTRGRWILRRKMLFEVLSDSEDEGSYTVVVSFCPVGDFETGKFCVTLNIPNDSALNVELWLWASLRLAC